jgi:hypothetical protein
MAWRGETGRHAYDKEETEEGTAIKTILAKANKSSWEIVQCAYFRRSWFS